MVCLASIAIAEEQHTSGSSSKNLRNQTVRGLPLDELTPQTRDRINEVVNKPSIYRRLPVTSVSADPDHFRFLIRYPEVVVKIWQLMGVTQMKTKRTGPYTISSDDGAGTTSSIELVYGTDNLHIFYGTGAYEGPILKRKLHGSCVLVLRSENQTGLDRKSTQTSQLDVFLKVENATAGLIAKTIQPIVGTTADHNFVESLKFIQRLNETTEKNGPGVAQMSERLDVDPEVRNKYVDVIEKVFQRAINASAPAEARTVRPTSLRTRQMPAQPPRTIEPSKFSNPGYPDYPVGPSPVAQTGGNRLPARGYQAPSYPPPTPNQYAPFSYQDSHQGQVRQQSYMEYYPDQGQAYDTAHAYRSFAPPVQSRPAQANYEYPNRSAPRIPIQNGGWRGR